MTSAIFEIGDRVRTKGSVTPELNDREGRIVGLVGDTHIDIAMTPTLCVRYPTYQVEIINEVNVLDYSTSAEQDSVEEQLDADCAGLLWDAADCMIMWWYNKRPSTWTEENHLEYPAVNCSGDVERSMAFTAANLVLIGWGIDNV